MLWLSVLYRVHHLPKTSTIGGVNSCPTGPSCGPHQAGAPNTTKPGASLFFPILAMSTVKRRCANSPPPRRSTGGDRLILLGQI